MYQNLAITSRFADYVFLRPISPNLFKRSNGLGVILQTVERCQLRHDVERVQTAGRGQDLPRARQRRAHKREASSNMREESRDSIAAEQCRTEQKLGQERRRPFRSGGLTRPDAFLLLLIATDPFVASEMESLASPMSCEAEEYIRSLRASAACIHRCSARRTALSAAVTRRTTFV